MYIFNKLPWVKGLRTYGKHSSVMIYPYIILQGPTWTGSQFLLWHHLLLISLRPHPAHSVIIILASQLLLTQHSSLLLQGFGLALSFAWNAVYPDSSMFYLPITIVLTQMPLLSFSKRFILNPPILNQPLSTKSLALLFCFRLHLPILLGLFFIGCKSVSSQKNVSYQEAEIYISIGYIFQHLEMSNE